MLVDSNDIALLHVNVNNEELRPVADAMQIEEFPYVVVYFEGNPDDNMHGLASEDTAIMILEWLEDIKRAKET